MKSFKGFLSDMKKKENDRQNEKNNVLLGLSCLIFRSNINF